MEVLILGVILVIGVKLGMHYTSARRTEEPREEVSNGRDMQCTSARGKEEPREEVSTVRFIKREVE